MEFRACVLGRAEQFVPEGAAPGGVGTFQTWSNSKVRLGHVKRPFFICALTSRALSDVVRWHFPELGNSKV